MRTILIVALLCAGAAHTSAYAWDRDNLPKHCPKSATCVRMLMLEDCYRALRFSITTHYLLRGTDTLLDKGMSQFAYGPAGRVMRSRLFVRRIG